MKILLIAPAGKAGTIQYTHNLANALVKKGNKVLLATAVDFELKPFFKAYRFLEVFDRFRPHPLKLGRFFYQLLRFKPDIVHLQGAQHPAVYLILCGLIRLFCKAPFVYTPQDVLPNHKGKFHIQAFRHLYKQFDHIFLNTSNNQQDIVKLFQVSANKISILSIPDLLAFLTDELSPKIPPMPGAKHVLLCFGLIEPRKGIHTLIEAMPEVISQLPDTLLFIVGKPLEPIQPYQNSIAELQLQAHVKLVPEYVSFEDMAGYFYSSDIVILPYYSGWNSGVISSAFSFKKPVIATDVAGFKDVIEDGKTGVIVPPKDAKSLAEQIVKLLKNKQMQAELIANAVESVKANSWEKIAEDTIEIYKKIT